MSLHRSLFALAAAVAVGVVSQGCSGADPTPSIEDGQTTEQASSCTAATKSCGASSQCCSGYCERESFSSEARQCCYFGTWDGDINANVGTHQCSTKADCCGYMTCDYDWSSWVVAYKVCLPGGKGQKCIYNAECRSGTCKSAACT
jgi:hypothetical protein